MRCDIYYVNSNCKFRRLLLVVTCQLYMVRLVKLDKHHCGPWLLRSLVSISHQRQGQKLQDRLLSTKATSQLFLTIQPCWWFCCFLSHAPLHLCSGVGVLGTDQHGFQLQTPLNQKHTKRMSTCMTIQIDIVIIW